MTELRRLSVIGMHAAGKTTYAGRLWLALQASGSRLKSRGLPESLQPFIDASNPLLANKYPDHTRMGHVAFLQVLLAWQSKQEDIPFQLSLTDYNGEELEDIFKKRHVAWSKHWIEQAQLSTGVILLVRSMKIRRPCSNRLALPTGEEGERRRFESIHEDAPNLSKISLSIDEPEDLFGEVLMPSDAQNPERSPDPHEPVHPPTEVALVEVLQFFRHERGLWMGEIPDPDCFRVAVAISCWDAVSEDWKSKGPAPFLRRHFPLLNDFLCTNFDPNGVAVFGISSTGGDLHDESFRYKYEKCEPENMGEVAFHPSRGEPPQYSSDLTLPIGWLLEGDAVFLPA